METNLKITQMLDFADKDLKTAIITTHADKRKYAHHRRTNRKSQQKKRAWFHTHEGVCSSLF